MRSFALVVLLMLAATASATVQDPPEAGQDPLPTVCEAWGAWSFFATTPPDTVAACIRAGADPLAPLDDTGATPLHAAAQHSPYPQVIAVIVGAGADANATDNVGATPLHLAARSNAHPGMIIALVEAGAEVNARDLRDNTPLHSAWRNPLPGAYRNRGLRINVDAVAELKRQGADPLARNVHGEVADPASCEHWGTPVFGRAADLAAYALCLERGADAGAADDYGNTVLHHAAANADPAVTALLLAAGAPAGDRNDVGETPLHTAAGHEHPAVVTVLLEAGADVNAGDDEGRTPLHAAATNESAEVVATLIEAGADVNATTPTGETPLGVAAKGANTTVADALLTAGAHVDVSDSGTRTRFETPLLASLWAGQSYAAGELTLRFLALGANPNVAGDLGWTPLYLAAFEHGPDMIRSLVEAGADPGLLTDDGESPLHPAAGYADPETIAALVEAGADPNTANDDGVTPLHRAVDRGKADNVFALLEAGADLNARTLTGDTPLHLAAARSDTTIVSALVHAGADLNDRNSDGETPLHRAWGHGNPLVVDHLVALGADVEVRDNRGRTPGASPACDLADYRFFRDAPLDSIKGCVEAGADVNGRNEHGWTPLHHAADTDSEVIATTLLDAGADVNARDSSGNAPLHTAAGRRLGDSPAMIALLAGAGARVNARNDLGETPLHLALASGSPATAARLLELGADPAARSGSGGIADPVSCENWNTKVFFAMADADVVVGCLEAGANVNARTEGSTSPFVNDPGSSPLHLAAEWSRDSMVVTVLLRSGADVLARGVSHYTALHHAARGGSPATVRALLQAGIPVDSRARAVGYHFNSDWTPLHLAAAFNPDPEVAAILLAAGADPHARGDAGQTPLHQAALNPNPAVAQLLLDAGADVHARRSSGRTPLHEAARSNANPEVIRTLLDAGADPESSSGGLPPLHEAARSNANPAIVTALIEGGADANRPAGLPGHSTLRIADLGMGILVPAGSTPLDLAVSSNRNPAVADALVRAGAESGVARSGRREGR